MKQAALIAQSGLRYQGRTGSFCPHFPSAMQAAGKEVKLLSQRRHQNPAT